MKLNHIFLAVVVAVSSLFSCHTVDEKTFEEEFIPDPTVVVRADLRGIVKDSDGNALSGANVKIGSETTISDNYGYFKFENILITASGALLEATSSGFLTAQKLVTPQTEDNYLQIRMVSLNASTSFSGASGGVVNLNDGASIQFLANSIVDANGNDYAGTVNVSSYYLSPTNPFMAELMPGSLRGVKSNGSLTILATLGMIYAELTDNNGRTLDIKEEYKSILKFPIPSEYMATAPSTMPMWTFNDETGFWEEEGQATLSAGFYEANVSHFSWWNADWPYNPIALKGTLVYDNAAQARTVISNTAIRVTLLDRPWSSTTVYTNNNGSFCAEIPQSNRVKLEVLNDCGELAYSFEVGPFGAETDLGEVVIDYAALPLMEVSGNLVDCDFEPITNGYAIIQYGEGYSIATVDENGFFSASIPKCNNSDSIIVRGFDFENLVESSTFSFVNSSLNLYVGELNLCVQHENIIAVYIDDERFVQVNNSIFNLSFTNNSAVLRFRQQLFITDNYLEGEIEFSHQGLGSYQNLILTQSSLLIVHPHIYNLTSTSAPLELSEVRIIELNDSKGKIEFEAKWEDQNGIFHDIFGYARN